MYCLFSLLTLLYFYFFEVAARRSKVLAFLAIVYLAFLMIFLSSKMFIFLLCLAGIAVIAYSFLQSRKLRRSSLSILALCIIIPILILKIPYSKSRIEYTQVKKYEGAEDNNNGLAVRGVLWKSAWEIIKEQHFLLGKGHYATQSALRLHYLNAGFEDGAIKNYNSHDQYLYTWACYGLFNLIVLLIFLFWFFWTTIEKRIFLGVFLSSIFIIANVTECMFETQKGLVFFLFFSGLLLFHSHPSPAFKEQSRFSHE
jgi:O-antigen ligase